MGGIEKLARSIEVSACFSAGVPLDDDVWLIDRRDLCMYRYVEILEYFNGRFVPRRIYVAVSVDSHPLNLPTWCIRMRT